jgi:hypothetical protein
MQVLIISSAAKQQGVIRLQSLLTGFQHSIAERHPHPTPRQKKSLFLEVLTPIDSDSPITILYL